MKTLKKMSTFHSISTIYTDPLTAPANLACGLPTLSHSKEKLFSLIENGGVSNGAHQFF